MNSDPRTASAGWALSFDHPLYAIAMDVGRTEDLSELKERILLFGIVICAIGKLGDEPVRSQGHVHAVAPHCGWSTPELFEIWQGHAIIYAQEKSGDDPGRCVAIEAGPGERVVMPPGHNSFSEHVVIANMDSTTRKCVRTTDSPGSRYSATVAKLIGTPIQIT